MDDSPVLDDYILGLPGKPNPNICFVPTAAGDSDAYIARFYRRFATAQCRPTHLELFRRDGKDLRESVTSLDID